MYINVGVVIHVETLHLSHQDTLPSWYVDSPYYQLSNGNTWTIWE